MAELFALADLLLLPSLRDPNPLAVIEGLWAGLPLFISNRCGNWPEAVAVGRNGWVIDPVSRAATQSAFKDVLSRSDKELESMGTLSMTIAKERFATTTTVTAFATAISALPSRRRRHPMGGARQ